MENKIYNKVHPYTIIEYLSKFMFLIIIPVVQRLLFKPQVFEERLYTLSIDIFIVIALVIYSIVEYKAIRYSINSRQICIKRGIIIKRKSVIPIDSIHSIMIKNLIIPSILGAIKLKINVPSGKGLHADINLTVRKKDVEKSVNSIFPQDKLSVLYKASQTKILLMALSWSNAATGLLIASPFINKMGSILGQEISTRIYSTIDITVNLVYIGVPPVAAAVGYIFFAGWVVSFCVQALRYSNFKLKKFEDGIIISRGLISTSTMIIDIDSINSISIKQTLLMRIFKLYSAYINAIGSGSDKGDKSMLIAATSKESALGLLNKIFSVDFESDKKINPPKQALKGYVLMPVLGLGLVVILSFMFANLGGYIKLIILADLLSLIIIGWWLAVRLIAYKISSVSVHGDTVLLNSYKRLSLIHTSIKLDKIQKIRVTQNPTQRLSDLCNMKIYIYSNRHEYFIIRRIPYSSVENIVENIENSQKINKIFY